MFIYPENLKAKPMLWLWLLRDIAVIGVAACSLCWRCRRASAWGCWWSRCCRARIQKDSSMRLKQGNGLFSDCLLLLSIPLNPLGEKILGPGNDFRRARTTVNADNTP